jgi:predicted TIM-barrel fold metal-dependent hydrolase
MNSVQLNGQWDCHAHLFGPYAQYPLAELRTYTPPEAIAQNYLKVLGSMGIDNGVLIHPSAYGDDHSLLLNTLKDNKRLRGVVVARADSPLNLDGLHHQGIRAARFSHRSGTGTNFLGSAGLEDFQSIQTTLANQNLHAELWTDCEAISDIDKLILNSPVPIVIDHMGGFNPRSGINDSNFQQLLRLLDCGHVWIKLSVYRNLLKEADWEIGKPFVQAMIKQNPDRLVWGSDWPHLRVAPVPDTSNLLSLLKSWTNDDSVLQKILTTNPAHLYG